MNIIKILNEEQKIIAVLVARLLKLGWLRVVLGVVFVTLKLTGYIDWSWWLVTLPFWVGLATFIVIIALAKILVKFKII